MTKSKAASAAAPAKAPQDGITINSTSSEPPVATPPAAGAAAGAAGAVAAAGAATGSALPPESGVRLCEPWKELADTCSACLKAGDTERILLCDGDKCGREFHLDCLDPPLAAVPEGDWLCPVCAAVPREHDTDIIGSLIQVSGTAQKPSPWRLCRVMQYKPATKEHQLRGVDDGKSSWMKLKDVRYQLAVGFVWAKMHRFPWWPALRLEYSSLCFEAGKQACGETHCQFLGDSTTTWLTPSAVHTDFTQPPPHRTSSKKSDVVVAAEQALVAAIRTAAVAVVEIPAETAAKVRASGGGAQLVGKCVQFFTTEVNYPQGKNVLGWIVRYSAHAKKHLIVCSEPLVKTKWTTLAGVRILDSDRAVSLPAATSDSCGVCRQGDSRGPLLRCSQCAALHHHSCCDPPVKSTVKSDADWICDSCRKCSGCKTTQPPGVRWDALSHRGRLNLLFCAACRAKYDAKDICVTCGLPWSTIEGNGVFCDSCQGWSHSVCENLTDEDMKLLEEDRHPMFGRCFWCVDCFQNHKAAVLKELREYVVACCCLSRLLPDSRAEMDSADQLSLFEHPVTDDVAPGYSTTIKTPMDLDSMDKKFAAGQYRDPNVMRTDFELIVLNAITYNAVGDVIWREAIKWFKAGNVVFDAHLPGTRSKLDVDDTINKKRTAARALVKGTAAPKAAPAKPVEIPQEYTLQRVQPKDDDPDMVVHDVFMMLDIAAALAWQDACACCGSFGDPDCLIFCCDCAQAYHRYCLPHAPSPQPDNECIVAIERGWRCVNCKICELCGDSNKAHDGQLLICEVCDRGYHMFCLSPRLDKVPTGEWVCGRCVQCTSCNETCAPSEWSYDASACLDCSGGASGLARPIKKACPVCNLAWTPTDMIRCDTCRLWLHRHCATLTRKDLEVLSTEGTPFMCRICAVARGMILETDTILKRVAKVKELADRLRVQRDARRLTELLVVRAVRRAVLVAASVNHVQAELARLPNSFEAMPDTACILPTFCMNVVPLESLSYWSFMAAAKCEPPPAADGSRPDPQSWLFSRCETFVARLTTNGKSLHAGITPDMAVDAAAFFYVTSRFNPVHQVNRLSDLGYDEVFTFPMFLWPTMRNLLQLQADPAAVLTASAQHKRPPSAAVSTIVVPPPFKAAAIVAGGSQGPSRMRVAPHQWWLLPSNKAAAALKRPLALRGVGVANADLLRLNGTTQQLFSVYASSTNSAEDLAPDMYCCLCGMLDSHPLLGRLLPVPTEVITAEWAHVQCLLWTAEVFIAPGEELRDAARGKSRGLRSKCVYCQTSGATVGCHRKTCNKVCHLGCAVRHGWEFTVQHRTFCWAHRSGQPATAASVEPPAKRSRKKVVKVEAHSTVPAVSPGVQSPSAAPASPSVPAEPAASPSVQAESPSVPAESPSVPAESPSVPAESPSVPAESPSVPAESPTIPAALPSASIQPPVELTASPESLASTNGNRSPAVQAAEQQDIPMDGSDAQVSQPSATTDIAMDGTSRSTPEVAQYLEAAAAPNGEHASASPRSTTGSPASRFSPSASTPPTGAIQVQASRGAAVAPVTPSLSVPWSCPGKSDVPEATMVYNEARKLAYSTLPAGAAVLTQGDIELRFVVRRSAALKLSQYFDHSSQQRISGGVEAEASQVVYSERVSGTSNDLPLSELPEGYPCLRSGSLTVLRWGEVVLDAPWHSANAIYPMGYMARRIFWSYKHPWQRCVYTCEVIADPGSSSSKPIMCAVITCDEDAQAVITAPTIAQAVSQLLIKVAARMWHLGGTLRRSDVEVYPFAPSPRVCMPREFDLWFFGLNLPIVRQVLETLPLAAGTSIVPIGSNWPQYRFAYHLPSEEDLLRIRRRREHARSKHLHVNASGSARCEGIAALHRPEADDRAKALVRSAKQVTDDTATSKDPGAGGVMVNTTGGRSLLSMYRELKAVPMEKRMVVRRSEIHGWGLYTLLDIPKDAMVVEYCGEIISQATADMREKRYEASGIGSCYLFRLSATAIVDATWTGCAARFINHCCEPNCYSRVIQIDGVKKIIIFAKRELTAGEEITYDYQFPIEEEGLPCRCGAANCRGRMN